MQILSPGCSIWFFCEYACGKSTLLLWIWAPRSAARLVCSLPMRSSKRLACDKLDTFATHAGLVLVKMHHKINDKNCTNQTLGNRHVCYCFRYVEAFNFKCEIHWPFLCCWYINIYFLATDKHFLFFETWFTWIHYFQHGRANDM